MISRGWRRRAAALLTGGAFALHQLRFVLGYGDHAHRQLGVQGHGYMTALAPLVGIALLLVLADFGLRLHARGGRVVVPPFRRLWAGAAGCLLVVYSLQESLEGALAGGHPAGLAGVFGHGGGAAVPLAAAIGLVIALVLRGSARAVELAAEPRFRMLPPRPMLRLGVPRPGRVSRGLLIARHLSARGPPLSSIP
jgi:hypothetical protein